jgi:uncharacterized membrane protein
MVNRSWIKRLLEETRQWVNEGIIDVGQEKRIKARYTGYLEYGRLINTIVTLGSILIGLGILLFVASNWDKLGRSVKISIIFAVISIFNLAGFYFRCIKKEFPGLGEGFLLIGAFSFGAGIWLIAQIYQIHYNFSAGILFWIIGILPLAFMYRSWIILVLSSILSFIWLFSYFSYYQNRHGYGFFILAGILLILCYLRRQSFSLFIVIFTLALWLVRFWVLTHLQISAFSAENILMPQLLLVAIYGGFGFLLYALGIWHQRGARWMSFSFLYKFLGILFITLPAYSLTFSHHYYKYSSFVVPLKAIFLIIVLFSAPLILLYSLYRSSVESGESKEIRLVFCFLLLQIIVFSLSVAFARFTSLGYNIILLFIVLIFMYLGFLRRSEGVFRLSIAIFFLDILSRYFDILWKMMPRSFLFMLGGLVLIFGALFVNKKRKDIEKKMNRSSVL